MCNVVRVWNVPMLCDISINRAQIEFKEKIFICGIFPITHRNMFMFLVVNL